MKENTALLVMHVQNMMVPDYGGEAILEPLQRAIAAARDNGLRVIHVRVAFTEGYPEVNPHNKMVVAVKDKVGVSLDGFTVVVNYAGSAGEAEQLAGKIEAAGGKALTAQADVSDAAAVARLFDKTEAAFGGIDVLVNNAGIMRLATIADGDDTLIDSQIAINLKGSIYTLREAARHLRDGGRIVNFSTSVVGLKLETYGVYVATKAAVEGLTGILAKELRGRNITVNAVAPGPTATALFLDGKSPELIERTSKMNPLERLGTPEDIAAAVAFLAGPDGAWINGQVLRANGGMV